MALMVQGNDGEIPSVHVFNQVRVGNGAKTQKTPSVEIPFRYYPIIANECSYIIISLHVTMATLMGNKTKKRGVHIIREVSGQKSDG